MRASLEGHALAAPDLEDQVAEVRAKVPEVHRDQFDELLEEARLTYKIRDERGVFSDIWASGIMRRAVLGCGRRLESEGRATTLEHLVDADIDEMRSLLSGATEPSADELAARFELRTSLSAKDAPQHLGDPPSPPPDPSQLPPGAGRMMRAMGIVMGEMFGASDAKHETDLVRGMGASPGVYEGPVRRVTGPSDFDRIVKGDVLVTESTSEAFNILLPLLGAIVTDRGGLLSHAAIVAREYGIPSVVGTREVTSLIARRCAGGRRRRQGRSDGPRVIGAVPLEDARDSSAFGSKAVGLGEAARAGLPVPPGVAISGSVVEAVASGDKQAIEGTSGHWCALWASHLPSAPRRLTKTAPKRVSRDST